MGIYDRDYYRNEGPSFLGSIAGTGRMCMILVVINVAVYLVQVVTVPDRVGGIDREDAELVRQARGFGPVTEWLAMKPYEVFRQGQIWRLVTGIFLHNPFDFWHLIWNMLFLFLFGRDLEDLYGRKEFLAFYLTAGALSCLFWGLTALWQVDQRGGLPIAFGASGAVMAVTVLCALHFPYRTIYLMFVLPLPYWAYALILVSLDLYSLIRAEHTGVGVAAHLAGAGFAALYWHRQFRLLELGGWFVSKARRTQRPQLRLYREVETVASAKPSPTQQIDPNLARQADAVLEKLHREGRNSLTPEENDILERASAEFRKRRR